MGLSRTRLGNVLSLDLYVIVSKRRIHLWRRQERQALRSVEEQERVDSWSLVETWLRRPALGLRFRDVALQRLGRRPASCELGRANPEK